MNAKSPIPLLRSYLLAASARWQRYAFFLIVFVNVIVYFPSFFHVARSDQVVYLANTAQVKGPALITQFYSYDRIPHVFNSAQSELLFRPLLMALLGVEKWLWGNNFIFWQIAGFLFHTWVLWSLFRLLLLIRKSFLAVVAVLFYSTLSVGSEMVTWHHVNGYLIYIGIILFMLRQLFAITESRCFNNKEMLSILLCLLAVSFLYEIGFLASLWVFVYLNFLVRPRRKDANQPPLWLLLLPPLLYLVISFLDLFAHSGKLGLSHTIAGVDPVKILRCLEASVYWWLMGGVCPFLAKRYLMQRTIFIVPSPDIVLRELASFTLAVKILFWNAVLFGGGLLVILGGYLRERVHSKYKLFIWLVVGLFFLHIGVITIGRLNVKGLEMSLQDNIYYSNFFWIFLAILIYFVITSQDFLRRSRTFFIIFLACWFNIIVCNTALTRALNMERRDRDQLVATMVQDIEQQLHKSQYGQSFSFKIEPEDYFTLNWVHRTNDPAKKAYNYFELIYLDNYDTSYPLCIYHVKDETFSKQCRK